ncbi:Gfo/Idh/MocA family oxidoreductase [Lentibacillus sediminis]|uniref:Gfo/Idh/MocA family oxidoreductase n=1 Tax=Lentibacillus sediminis TaxID=1940529 RepID=UPI000C1BB6EB|nr:Gfo/Idh/MocA family oxidoreductase [Lentibacillus sediminis]
MVDLDTSHPKAWLPILRSLGHEVIGVYDGGTVYPPGYAEHFASENSIDRVFESLDEMAEVVDMAMIHSVNWDLHLERARPFVHAEKALFIDKPMAGNRRDLEQLLEWESQGMRITGGSALRYCNEVSNWLNEHDPFSEFVFAMAGCSTDEFNYGIHAYSLMHGLLGSGMESVRYLGSSMQQQIEIAWEDGRKGLISVGATKGYLPFYATVVTENDVSHFQVDNNQLYRPMLETVLPYLAGETQAPVPLQSLIEIELAAIAARRSWQKDGRRIFLKDIPLDEPGYDGMRFAKAYR